MMNTAMTTPAHPARRALATTLAVLSIAPFAQAQAGDAAAVRRLQEENAALRKQLAEIQAKSSSAPAIQPAATPATPAGARPSAAASTAASRLNTDEGVQVLTPFEVKSDKDYGYLKTNAATATKLAMEIQNIPLNISVISREFLDDTNTRSLTDLFRYSAAASGDTRFAMRVPANSATPQGQFTMRGFHVNTLMRNGVFRYISHNFDNIDRVEVVKGPATVFFGQGYPGGVINYITKQPDFSGNKTDVDYYVNSNSGHRVMIDQNQTLGKKAALRIIGGWEDTQGERRFEYRRANTVTPSLSLIPFDSGKVKITAEAEFLREKFSWNDYDWIFSDFAGWREAATTGRYNSSTATLANTIVANAGNGLTANVVQNTNTPTLAYATYINNKRIATSNWSLPAYTGVERGAYYTNAAGQWVHDEAFNYTSRGAHFRNTIDNLSVTVDLTPFSWLDVRYNFLNEKSENYSVGQGGALTTPYANGINWNAGTGNLSGYYRYAPAVPRRPGLRRRAVGLPPRRPQHHVQPGLPRHQCRPVQPRRRSLQPGHPRPHRRHQAGPPDLLELRPGLRDLPGHQRLPSGRPQRPRRLQGQERVPLPKLAGDHLQGPPHPPRRLPRGTPLGAWPVPAEQLSVVYLLPGHAPEPDPLSRGRLGSLDQLPGRATPGWAACRSRSPRN